ncbi:hypothetical protein C8R44DRAFT_895796 [Mycena epipterygia]|nr:hypothetical protein C8R44DRAFT_895796 [Mycena epipterygia]
MQHRVRTSSTSLHVLRVHDPAFTDAGDLPRTLAPPAFTRDALAAAASDLAAVPAEFIRKERSGHRRSRPRTSHPSAVAAPVTHHCVPACTAALAADPPSYPTHALAIAPAGKDVGAPHATFSVHCASHTSRTLPSRPGPANSPSSMSLPVLSLALPSPQAIAILHGLQRLTSALTTLLLLPPAFLASLKRPSKSHDSHSRSQDAAHTAILAALTSGTTRYTFPAHLRATSGGSLTPLIGHARILRGIAV